MTTTRKKIILVAYDFNPYYGSECHVATIWYEIIKEIFDVHIITSEAHKKDIENHGKYQIENFSYVPVSIFWAFLDKKLNLQPLLSYMKFRTRARKIIGEFVEKEKIEVIHCLTPEGVYYYNDFYKFGLPVFVGPVGGGLTFDFRVLRAYRKQIIPYFLKYLLLCLMRINVFWRLYYKMANKIIIGTRYMKEVLPEESENKMVEIFDTAVDYIDIKGGASRGKKIVKIIYAGRLTAHKGIWLAIDTVEKLKTISANPFEFTVLGNGSLNRHIRRYIKVKKMEGYVKVVNKVPMSEYKSILIEHDIFLFPALQDPGGTTVLDAMMSGLPVVCVAYGGPDISVDDKSGLKSHLQEYDRLVSDLANKVKVLIDDEKLRQVLGNGAKQRVEIFFSKKHLAQKIHELYREYL